MTAEKGNEGGGKTQENRTGKGRLTDTISGPSLGEGGEKIAY